MKSQLQLPQPATPPAAGATDSFTHFVYLVACADRTLYTGYTINIERRLAAHNAGKGARYTRGRRPVTLLATWQFTSKGEALRAERAIKGLSRQQKWRLVLEGSLGGNLQTTRVPNTIDSAQPALETGEHHDESI